MDYRMFMRARHIHRWAMYDVGTVTVVPSTHAEALGMVPASEFQAIDRFYFVPIEA